MSAQPQTEDAALAIHVRHTFAAPRESVFRAWTDPQVLKRWWCPPGWAPGEMAIDLRVGGAYRIGMRRLRSHSAVYVQGRFVEVDCPKRLVYTWRWQNAFEHMPETQVTVLFTEAASGGTEVVLKHENLPAIPVCLRHWNGWKAAWPRMEAALNRVLATVLFTDIVGSTAHANKVGDRRWRELLNQYDDLVRRHLQRLRGRQVKATGDGTLATFDGPARAIECARGIVEGVRALGLEVRAGLHTGEVEPRGKDLAGVAVHIAARVSGLAGPGEVLVSRTVTDLVAGSGIEFVDRGEHELKGLPGTWKLFAVRG